MSFLTPSSPQVASNGRNKVALKPGHSLMDWVRFKAKLPPVRPRRITQEELASHRSLGDVWTAINGAVYDISTYIDYHPGGEAELMRGAGIDSTDLFNEVHKWVNFQNMLKECLVGYLVTEPKISLTVPGQTSATGSPFLKPLIRNEKVPPTIGFSFDTYQTQRCITLIVYGKIPVSKKVRSISYHCAISLKTIDAYIQCIHKEFRLHLDLFEQCSDIEIRHNGPKLEFVVHKTAEKLWPSEGIHSENSKSITEKPAMKQFNIICTANEEVSHDCRLLTFTYQDGFYAVPPIGSHIFVHNPDKTSIVDKRPYTVFKVLDNKTFQLLVKRYESGIISPFLCSLSPMDEICVDGFDHFLDMNLLHSNSKLVLLAAGTGITPFYRILLELSSNRIFSSHTCDLFFYNKTQKDILIEDMLSALTANSKCKISVVNVLSRESWTGLMGHLEKQHLSGCSAESIFLVCGPLQFMELARGILKEIGVGKQNIIEFKG